MPYDPVDPASLEGEALMRWYRRTPQEIDEERRRAAAEAYNRFFYPTQFNQVPSSASAATGQPKSGSNDTLWIATGSGGFRAVRSESSNFGTTQEEPDGLPDNPASPEEADFIEIGNPHNPRLRRQWQKANGQPWPKTDDGRNYHVAHKRAIADGGTNTLDNIEPMHPDEHIAQHLNNGDSARWGLRASIARAFGGTVEPPNPGRTVRGLGVLSIFPWIAGFLSGHIRTDTPTHTWYDMAGFPAPDDYDQMTDPNCRAMGINTSGGKCT